jgi:hypothetical protein
MHVGTLMFLAFSAPYIPNPNTLAISSSIASLFSVKISTVIFSAASAHKGTPGAKEITPTWPKLRCVKPLTPDFQFE